jgi:hypothetical protein
MPLAVLIFALSAVLTEFISGIAGSMVVVTGVAAGSARAWAVLRKSPHERIEWMTAVGFALGAVFTIAIVCIDSILELQ